MKYSVQFFEAEPKVRKILRDIPSESITSVIECVRLSSDYAESDRLNIKTLLEFANRKGWPVSESVDQFLAFEWILKTFGKQIELNQLRDFNHWDYLVGTHLWRYFTKGSFPFDIPRSPYELPCIGFVSHDLMEEILERELPAEPSIPGVCRQNRQELLEVMESLKTEELDLYAVAFVAG